MTQVHDGASPFERPMFSPQEALAPWLAFAAQAATSYELYAVRHALDAVCCELDLLRSFEQGVSFMRCGSEELVSVALNCFQSTQQLHLQAIWHWQQAANWLREFGRSERQALYHPLATHVRQQQGRLADLGEQLVEQATRLSQEWGLTLEEG